VLDAAAAAVDADLLHRKAGFKGPVLDESTAFLPLACTGLLCLEDVCVVEASMAAGTSVQPIAESMQQLQNVP
jgi:hypothetical protein